jgi:hypothetical protein
MNINGTTLIAIVTAPLIIGSLLGAPYQTRPNPRAAAAPDPTHSNYIRIEIRPGTKVAVVAPEVGDTVEWYPQATNANPNPLPATVRFQGKPPCAGHNTGDPISACKVTTRGNFEYDCVPPGTCVDPGMDPRSQTGTVLQAMPAPSGGGAPPPPPPVRAPALALAPANGPPAIPTMTISCDQTQTPTIVPQDKNPLAAYQSQQISWIAGAVSDFIINIPPKFCMEDTTGTGHIQADNVAVCTVAADADTTKPAYYSVSGVCTGNKTGNFTINIAKWPPTK